MSQCEPSPEPNTAHPTPPVLVTACVREIRAAGGNVHHSDKYDYGYLIRAEFGPKQFRVVLPPIVAGAHPDVPNEGNSPAFLVRDLPGLTGWLQAIKPLS